MPSRSTEALVLDAAPYRDRDKIVTLFTESEGKVRGVAHGAARSVKRFGGRLERFSRVRATYFEREGMDLVRIDDLELVRESFRLQQDIRVSAALSYVCEVAGEFVGEKESDRRYYRLLGALLEAFRAGMEINLLLRYFEFWTARLHGIFPEFEGCDGCGSAFGPAGARVAAAGGAAMCTRCARGAGERMLSISASALTAIAAFKHSAPAALANVIFPASALDQIEAAATAALSAFAGREFRSRAFLRQVLAQAAK